MKLAKFRHPNGPVGVGIIDHMRLIPLNISGRQYNSLSDILEADDPLEVADFLAARDKALSLSRVRLMAPIDQQEVWAAGVTYQRSQSARMEESEASADCYDRVYRSPRPELFFKATPHRVAGPSEPVRVRKDSEWSVPEPEITLVLNSHLRLTGFTVGNDMSARDIEGENPLYLPQAKVYEDCCSLGPCVTLASGIASPQTMGIQMSIQRNSEVVFSGSSSAAQMARTFDELIGWLGRDNAFPYGVFLLTGTGIVPDTDFTLQAGDTIEITVEGVGTLINSVQQG